MCVWGGGRENRDWDGHLMKRVSLGDDENVLELDSGDGCTTLWMHYMLLNYIL